MFDLTQPYLSFHKKSRKNLENENFISNKKWKVRELPLHEGLFSYGKWRQWALFFALDWGIHGLKLRGKKRTWMMLLNLTQPDLDLFQAGELNFFKICMTLSLDFVGWVIPNKISTTDHPNQHHLITGPRSSDVNPCLWWINCQLCFVTCLDESRTYDEVLDVERSKFSKGKTFLMGLSRVYEICANGHQV